MNHDEALRKVRALLNLADQKRGGTPEEAALAAAKAQEIMTKFGIDVGAADYDSEQKKLDAEPIRDFGYGDPLDEAKYGKQPPETEVK